MKTKKLVCGAIALVLSLGCLAACGKETHNCADSLIYNEPVARAQRVLRMLGMRKNLFRPQRKHLAFGRRRAEKA